MSVSYVRVNFKNRVVERPRTYIITTNGDGSVTLTPAFGEVEEAGVPLNAENLNKMDKGTSDCAEAINGLEISVTLLGQSVQSAEQDIEGLREDLTNDEAAIGDNAREINALKTRADTAEGNILALSQNDAAIAQDLIAKQAAIDGNATQINQLKSRVDAAETNIRQKQDKLTFDPTPTSGSGNPVTSGGVKAALDAKAVNFTASIPATGWTSQSSGAYYTINVSLSGILATDKPDIGIVQTGTWATDEAIRDAWASITRIVAAANQLQITADSIPSRAIPIQVRCIR